jgi:hypothetical protein
MEKFENVDANFLKFIEEQIAWRKNSDHSKLYIEDFKRILKLMTPYLSVSEAAINFAHNRINSIQA